MIPLPYKLAIVGVALVGTFFVGREHGLQRYYDYRATVAAQMEQVERENAARIDAMEAAHQQAIRTWDAARRVLADRPVVRVQPHRCEGILPTAPTAPTRVEGLQTGQSGSGAERTITAEECEARINGSVMDAVWIETVKKLTDDMHEVSK